VPEEGVSKRPRRLQVQPVNMSVQLVGVQPMQESESVVANWTCEMGNHLHESSEGNALALARGGRAEGLASDRAATLGIAVAPLWGPHERGSSGE